MTQEKQAKPVELPPVPVEQGLRRTILDSPTPILEAILRLAEAEWKARKEVSGE